MRTITSWLKRQGGKVFFDIKDGCDEKCPEAINPAGETFHLNSDYWKKLKNLIGEMEKTFEFRPRMEAT